MKKLMMLLVAMGILLAACSQVDTPDAQPAIKVLYVGQHPDTTEGYLYGGDINHINELKKTRSADFMALLTQHFDATLVYGEAYKPAMSANYDVTIIDALTMELDGKDMDGSLGANIAGERSKYTPLGGWRWLPEDFDHATIFIAATLANVGSSLDLSLNSLCNCLGKTIFELDESHPVFNTPHKVSLDYQQTPYAPGVYHYYTGRDLPAATAMLQMEIDDIDGKPLPPGLVTVPGVGDSPDTEMISKGTCIKMVDAVAIARQGSFFQWGVRASPSYMTEAAQLTFLNAVHYIKDFAGAKRLITRVADYRMNAMDVPYHLSDQGWANKVARFEELNARNKAMKDRVAAGTATDEEKKRAKFLKKAKQPKRGSDTHGIPESLKLEFGDDWDRYLKYYEENFNYIYSDGGEYIIDQDAVALGIANNDSAILARSIELLESGEQQELAQRVLTRYTNMDYSAASDWRNWFDSNRDKLFFTEVGGYKFMVNTL